MKHEDFPVEGFEFMDEEATETQKDIIVDLCNKRGTPVDRNGIWPNPFTKYDAATMIERLKGE